MISVKVSELVYLVITIIEKAIVLGDITTMKKEAIQLGYLCCAQLKNPEMQRIFRHRLSDTELAIPTLEQIAQEVCYKNLVM